MTHGQALLDTLLQHVESMHSTRKTIQVLALQAWAYDLQGRAREALDVLERALTLARPNGFIRTFADLPALVNVLQGLRKRRQGTKGDRHKAGYLPPRPPGGHELQCCATSVNGGVAAARGP